MFEAPSIPLGMRLEGPRVALRAPQTTDVAELRERIEDAWLIQAPKSLSKEYLER